MERLVFPAAAFVAPLFSVALKVRDIFRAFLLIEYTTREDFTRRLDASIDARFRYDFEIQRVHLTVNFLSFARQLFAGFHVSSKLAVLDIVRPPALTVGVAPVFQHLHVVPQALARVFVIVGSQEGVAYQYGADSLCFDEYDHCWHANRVSHIFVRVAACPTCWNFNVTQLWPTNKESFSPCQCVLI